MKTKNILFLLTINYSLLTIHCFAQLVQQEWVARYSGPGGAGFGGPFLAVDKLGNSFVGGTHIVNDTINILVVKYNSSGVQQWAVLYKYSQGGCFDVDGLALDSSGNPYIAGMFFIPDCIGSRNIVTVKFSTANGSVIWEKPYYDADSREIKIDRQNNIYVVGIKDSSALCMKYNSNGDSIWVRRYQSSGRSAPYACAIDDSLNILITGYSRFSMPPVLESLLVVKYSTDGLFRWARSFAYDNAVNKGLKITTDQYGNAYIGGITRVSGLGVYLTLKYDRNGVQQWASIYDAPGDGDNDLKSVAVDRIHNFVFVTGYAHVNSVGVAATIKYNALTGDSIWVRTGVGTPGMSSAWDIKSDTSGNSYITGAMPGSSSSDVFTLKYSPQGNQVWLITYNGPFGADGGRALEIHNPNNIYVLGYSQSSPTVSDYVTIKYSQLVGIQPVSNEIPRSFKLYQNYPNPFNPNTIINYELPITNYVRLIVYDILGREIATLVNERQDPGSYNARFDGSKYSSGVYFYKLVADGNVINTKKLIIVK